MSPPRRASSTRDPKRKTLASAPKAFQASARSARRSFSMISMPSPCGRFISSHRSRRATPQLRACTLQKTPHAHPQRPEQSANSRRHNRARPHCAGRRCCGERWSCVQKDSMVARCDEDPPHRDRKLSGEIGDRVQGDVHAQLHRALEVHTQNILQIDIAKQFFMCEPSLGKDSVHASAKRSHFRKMSISSMQASPHLALERAEHHWPPVFPVSQGPDGQFGQKGRVTLHRHLAANLDLRQKLALCLAQIGDIDLAPPALRTTVRSIHPVEMVTSRQPAPQPRRHPNRHGFSRMPWDRTRWSTEYPNRSGFA